MIHGLLSEPSKERHDPLDKNRVGGSLTETPPQLQELIIKFNQDYDEKAHRYIALKNKNTADVIFIPASYRGNDAYTRRTLHKFNDLKRAIYSPISKLDLIPQFGLSNCLHLILEYDANEYEMWDTWSRVPADLNRILNALRKRYGKIDFIKKPEAHYSGYPHLHLLIYFHQYKFHTFWHNEKLLVQETKSNKFNPSDKSLEDLWSHGYIRVEACTNLTAGLNYLGSKYFTKTLNLQDIMGYEENDRKKGLYTLVIGQYLRQKSYTLSRGFSKLVKDYRTLNENTTMRNTNYDKSSFVDSSTVDKPWLFLGVGRFKVDLPQKVHRFTWLEYCNLLDSNLDTGDPPIFVYEYENTNFNTGPETLIDYEYSGSGDSY